MWKAEKNVLTDCLCSFPSAAITVATSSAAQKDEDLLS